MEEPTLKNRLEVGEKIFYFDGQTQWDIETVESVNKAEKYAVLSNNARISRYPRPDGTFEKLNQTKGSFSKPDLLIKRATDDLIKLRAAILSYRKINGYIYLINNVILKNTNLKNWNRWTNNMQEKLICLAGYLAKGIEEAELDEESMESLAKALNEPIENIKPVENKRKKRNKK